MTRFLLLASLFYLIGCSATKETTEENSTSEPQSVYVFDDVTTTETESTEATSTAAAEVSATEAVQEVTKPTTMVVDNEETNSSFQFFIVQLGAFSTLGKAETFVNTTKSKTNYEMNIHYSDKVNLHVVQLTPFRTREKADEVRDELRNIKEFDGAFIVPNNQ